MGQFKIDEEVDQIFQNIDVDNTGFIQFTEWCAAAMDKR